MREIQVVINIVQLVNNHCPQFCLQKKKHELMNHKPFFNSLAASKLKACDVTFCLVAASINVFSLLFVTFILRFKFGVGTRTQQP